MTMPMKGLDKVTYEMRGSALLVHWKKIRKCNLMKNKDAIYSHTLFNVLNIGKVMFNREYSTETYLRKYFTPYGSVT